MNTRIWNPAWLAAGILLLLAHFLALAGEASVLLVETENSVQGQALDQSFDGRLIDHQEDAEKDLRDRVRSLRDKTAVLIEDARQLSDKTKELSRRAERLIDAGPEDTPMIRSHLRGTCSSQHCGVACMKDCKAQCSIVRLLGLDDNAQCDRTKCARVCATGCSRDACSFRFIYKQTSP
jgi:hypothetical protein